MAVALLLAAALRAHVVEAYSIPSASMEPTIMVGDRVLVDKLSYVRGHPRVGDIVVFTTPPDFYDPTDPGIKDLIKRVIGLPGQSLRTAPDGAIYVDGRRLAQPWLTAGAVADPGPVICDRSATDCAGRTLHLPPGRYLVMGDNRADSTDGRIFGPIAGSSIVGRAVVCIWPLGRIHLFGGL